MVMNLPAGARKLVPVLVVLGAVGPGALAVAQGTSATKWKTPVAYTSVSAGFYDPSYAKTQSRQHLGTDLTAPGGRAVYSPVAGKVIVNKTTHPDINEAYMVIKDSATGEEHVLGHIYSSGVANKTVYKAGQYLGDVRPWPGQPSRSHVHWGVHGKSVASAVGGTWGWGRAAVTSTKSQALARGWIDITAHRGKRW